MKQVPQDVLEAMLAKMTALMRDHPTITVRELASKLGFAEERSIYYWLKKAGYHGIRDFRDVILQPTPVEGQTPAPSLPSVSERSGRLERLPVRRLAPVRRRNGAPKLREAAEPFRADEGDPGAPSPVRSGPTRDAESPASWLPTLGSGAYVLTVDTPGYAPVLDAGDALLVDPTGSWQDGDLVVVERPEGSTVIGRVYRAEPTILVHPARPKEVLRFGPNGQGAEYHIARVVQLIRSFQ